MLTKNFYDTIAYRLFGITAPRENSLRVSMGGTSYKLLPSGASYYTIQNFSINELMVTKANTAYLYEKCNSQTYGYIFGTGNVAPTVDDIKLSGDIIASSKIAVTNVKTFSNADDTMQLTVEYTIANNADQAITIGEVGLVDYFHFAQGSGSSYQYYYPMLLERTALETPITIEAGGVGKVTYTVELASIT